MKRVSFLLLGAGFMATNLFAAPPYSPDMGAGGNIWRMTGFADESAVHKPVLFGGTKSFADYCFYPTGTIGEHRTYNWYSLTFKGARGTARQEGDKIVMHGDFPTYSHGLFVDDAGHESATFELVSGGPTREGYGEQVVWLELGHFGKPLGFINIKMQRQVKQCRAPLYFFEVEKLSLPPFQLPPEIERDLEVVKDENGGLKYVPIQEDLDFDALSTR